MGLKARLPRAMQILRRALCVLCQARSAHLLSDRRPQR